MPFLHDALNHLLEIKCWKLNDLSYLRLNDDISKIYLISTVEWSGDVGYDGDICDTNSV